MKMKKENQNIIDDKVIKRNYSSVLEKNKLLSIVILGYSSLLFNGEVYAHGLMAFILYPLVIFYFIYVIILKFIYEKYHISYKKLFFAGSLTGLLLETFYSKSIFNYPFFLGINWFSVIIQAIYWGLSAALPFYVYNLLIKKEKLNYKIIISIIFYLVSEIFLGTIRFQTIWSWIITGIIFGTITLPIIFKQSEL